MKFTFLGVGSAFTVKNFHSNMFVEVNGRRLLIDAGGYLPLALARQGLKSTDFDGVYISHLHADHIGGLEFLALTTKFSPAFVDASGKHRKLKLFIGYEMPHDLWHNAMEAGCATLQGQENTLSTFFDVNEIPKNGSFEFEGTRFELVQTLHYVNNKVFAPSYGLFWQAPNEKKVFLTTDTQFAPHSIFTFYNQADLIFHDCETSPNPSGIHAHYDQLKTLDPKIRKRMYLYHYQDGPKPNCRADGFAGWVRIGQTFDLSKKEKRRRVSR